MNQREKIDNSFRLSVRTSLNRLWIDLRRTFKVWKRLLPLILLVWLILGMFGSAAVLVEFSQTMEVLTYTSVSNPDATIRAIVVRSFFRLFVIFLFPGILALWLFTSWVVFIAMMDFGNLFLSLWSKEAIKVAHNINRFEDILRARIGRYLTLLMVLLLIAFAMIFVPSLNKSTKLLEALDSLSVYLIVGTFIIFFAVWLPIFYIFWQRANILYRSRLLASIICKESSAFRMKAVIVLVIYIWVLFVALVPGLFALQEKCCSTFNRYLDSRFSYSHLRNELVNNAKTLNSEYVAKSLPPVDSATQLINLSDLVDSDQIDNLRRKILLMILPMILIAGSLSVLLPAVLYFRLLPSSKKRFARLAKRSLLVPLVLLFVELLLKRGYLQEPSGIADLVSYSLFMQAFVINLDVKTYREIISSRK